MICLVKRTWERLTPWPSPDQRREAIEAAADAHAAAVRQASHTDELTERVRKIRANNGFREAFEMSLHRKPHPQP